MKKSYYLSVNNENLYSEFLRFDNQFLSRSELIKLSPEEIREIIMVAIDSPNIKDLFFPFKKKILYFLEYKKLNQKNKYFFLTYIPSFLI